MADILAVGAHPDDVEISIGGTLIKMVKQGCEVVICHLTDGEPTPHGSHETRVREAAEAAALIGARLEILDMPNRYLFDCVEARVELANVIRKHRPRILLSPYVGGAHPDHRAAGNIADAARFYAKLTRYGPDGKPWQLDPWWTPEQFYFSLGVRVDEVKPDFVIDITDERERKMDVLACYESQFNVDMFRLGGMEIWGPLIGVAYGEAFFSRGTIGLRSLLEIIQRPERGTIRPVTTNEPQEGGAR